MTLNIIKSIGPSGGTVFVKELTFPEPSGTGSLQIGVVSGLSVPPVDTTPPNGYLPSELSAWLSAFAEQINTYPLSCCFASTDGTKLILTSKFASAVSVTCNIPGVTITSTTSAQNEFLPEFVGQEFIVLGKEFYKCLSPGQWSLVFDAFQPFYII